MSNIPCERCSWDPTLVIGYSYTLVFPFAALSLNELAGNAPGKRGWKYRQMRNRCEAVVRGEAFTGAYQANQKMRAQFTRWYGKRKRPFDMDNLIAGMKPVRDSLTLCGLLVDDSPTWLEAHYEQRPHPDGENTITVLLEAPLWPTN